MKQIQEKKEYLTISEMAKLCNVTVAALKHYEKINLLKPDYIDPKNQYRYYSIYQYEKIETIRELRELNIPLSSISKYMNDRNMQNSLQILKERYSNLENYINELRETKDSLKKQINLIKQCSNAARFNIREEIFKERTVLLDDKRLMHDVETGTLLDFSYSVLYLEKLHSQGKNTPTLAKGNLGLIIPKEEIDKGNLTKSIPAIFTSNSRKKKDNEKKLPGGKYVCLMYKGPARERETYLKQILAYIEQHEYEISGDVIHINLIDETISEYPEEFCFDLQVPVAE